MTLFDPLMPSHEAEHHWTTTNLGEAAPGVLTPLCLSLWGAPAERASRRAAWTIGVMRDDELSLPDRYTEWVLRPFYGRLAMRLEFMAELGDRVPGTTGVEAIRGMFGEAPPGMTFHPTRDRYAAIAWKFPQAFRRFPDTLLATATEQDAWWRRSVAMLPSLGKAEAVALFADAVARFERSSSLQLVGTIASVQPLYDAVEKLIAKTGIGDIGVLSGSGGAEMAVIADIWRASRGQLNVEDVLRNHGFHGPAEGELSSTVWREDPTPLEAMVQRYAARSEDESPIAAERRRERLMASQRNDLLRALPAWQRPVAKLTLGLAAKRIPLRGVAKRSFLQAIDVARGAARRVGDALVAEDLLDTAADVFLLTESELCQAGVREIADARRALRAEYLGLEFAATEWRGLPETVARSDDAIAADVSTLLTGTGVSSGIVEGVVRVVTDPSFTDVEPDEILVAQTTDPSWSSIMFISSALVVDMGGILSHAAVVARELGIPCVVNTRTGTRTLRTGDRVRVDGGAGTVELIARAPTAAAAPA